jgi:tetratricopeptide (TPR) repeat protein/DNA-binding CsgD family transcriptional regulator
MNPSRTQILSEIRTWDLSQIETALEEATQRGSTSDEAFFIRARAYHFFRKGMISEAKADTNRAIELAITANDSDVLGTALDLHASILTLQGDSEAEGHFLRAIDLLVESGNLASESATRCHYGNLLNMHGSPSDALEQYEKALACCEAADQPALKTLPLNGIGNVYYNAAEYHRAIDAWKNSSIIAREYHQDDHLFTAIYNIANTFGVLNDNERAELYGQEALAFASERNEFRDLPLCYELLAKVHQARGNFDLAIQEFERSRALFLQMDNRRDAVDVRQSIGRCLVESGKIDEGIEVLKEVVEELLVVTEQNKLMATYESLVDAYKRKEDYQSAFEYFQKQTSLKDEVFNSDFKNRLVTLEKKLEEQRTEAATKLFQTQARKLEEELRLQATAQATQTELLSNFREDLRQIVKHSYDPVSAMKKISEQLKSLQVPKLDWAKLEKEFIAIHPDFRRTLQQRFPELSNQELRLCQLLRTGLKSNEAARLMGVSERGVEQHRLRIRRKLDLKGNKSLTDFLAEL